jgi:hypothetical protein
MTKALYTDATCSAASSMSTDKLHERVCAPFRPAGVAGDVGLPGCDLRLGPGLLYLTESC